MQKSSIWSKIGQSIAALVIVLALVNSTGYTFSWSVLIFLIAAFIVLAAYWHLVDLTREYFQGLRDDVKYIKQELKEQRKRMNKKGKQNILGTIAQVIGAVVLLYVLWLVLKATWLS
jgi:hypothetical protein